MHQADGEETQPIELCQGVKQGDPMSPLLFNLSTDSLLRLLECEGAELTACGVRVASLAFADDLVLLSDLALNSTKALSGTACPGTWQC